MLNYHGKTARERADETDAKLVAIDEIATKRGEGYVCQFVDIDRRRVLYRTKTVCGTDTVGRFAVDLQARAFNASRIKEDWIDMSARRSAVKELFAVNYAAHTTSLPIFSSCQSRR